MTGNDAIGTRGTGLRSGDAEFVGLYRRHGGQITRYLRRCLGDSLAEDAAAEVFARALERTGADLHRVEHALPWLYGIAAHVVADHHRAEKRRLRAIERLARTVDQASDDRYRHALDPQIARALRELSPGDRQTFLLVAWGELSYEETAEALGVPIGTVRSRIARVRGHFNRRLGRPGPGRAPATGETHA